MHHSVETLSDHVKSPFVHGFHKRVDEFSISYAFVSFLVELTGDAIEVVSGKKLADFIYTRIEFFS